MSLAGAACCGRDSWGLSPGLVRLAVPAQAPDQPSLILPLPDLPLPIGAISAGALQSGMR